jgi:hypothetical protein
MWCQSAWVARSSQSNETPSYLRYHFCKSLKFISLIQEFLHLKSLPHLRNCLKRGPPTISWRSIPIFQSTELCQSKLLQEWLNQARICLAERPKSTMILFQAHQLNETQVKTSLDRALTSRKVFPLLKRYPRLNWKKLQAPSASTPHQLKNWTIWRERCMDLLRSERELSPSWVHPTCKRL